MAKASRSVLFLAVDVDIAKTAASAFSTTSSRLGLAWTVESAISGTIEKSRLKDFTVVVAVDLPEFTPPEASTRLEHVNSGSALEESVNGLLARLLGGSDAAPPSKPPPPAPPRKVHTVKLSRETAGRRGKGVTVVSELPLGEEQLKELATLLKNKCGTGGTAKDGRIEIQGDQRDRLAVELEQLGYKVKRAGG